VERGDTGLGRDAYGLPRRWRLGERRASRPGGGAEGRGKRRANEASGLNGLGDAEDDEYYGQLLRRPGDPPPYSRQPDRPRPRQPGRFPPPGGNPAAGYPPNSGPASGDPGNGDPASGYPPNGGPAFRRQYRLPNGRRFPPAADRPYRPRAPGPAGGTPRRPGPGQDRLGGGWSRPAQPSSAPGAQAYGGTAGFGAAGTAQPVASIAPDGLEAFARDLRALRAKAELDYPEMAERSHYTMKTLASAAGGLRLPALPVAVAYVRACGGDVAEWEDRWHTLATKITADAGKKRRGDGDDQQAPPEPADPAAIPEPPALPAARDPDPEPGEVYVITSAKPRQPGW
jgi:hypothetical protein